MKLLLLYGLPAVGKLTIAKEIARLTGSKVFHSHLTVDLVVSIFPRGTPAYRRLLWDIHFTVVAEAARANIDGLIFTMVYGRDREPFIARCVEVVESFGGEVCLVHLHCPAEALRQRVVREDRKQHGKITSVELLNETLRFSSCPSCLDGKTVTAETPQAGWAQHPSISMVGARLRSLCPSVDLCPRHVLRAC